MSTEKRFTEYDSLQTYLTTELDSLADGANKLGAAIDFAAGGTDRKLFMDIEVYLASVNLSAQTNPALYIWLIRRTDGTNFEDGGDSITPARAPDKIIPLREVNGAQRVSARMLMLMPDQGKLLIGNRAGAALASSGNTVKYNIYSVQDV